MSFIARLAVAHPEGLPIRMAGQRFHFAATKITSKPRTPLGHPQAAHSFLRRLGVDVSLSSLAQPIFPPPFQTPASDPLYPLSVLAYTDSEGAPLYPQLNKGAGGRRRARARRRLHLIRRANAAILELNRLWAGCVGTDFVPVGGSPPGAAGRSLTKSILTSVQLMRRHLSDEDDGYVEANAVCAGDGPLSPSNELPARGYNELTTKDDIVLLHSETAAIPAAGNVPVPFADFGVVPALHTPDGGALREAPPTQEQVNRYPCTKAVARGQWGPLLTGMNKGGMVDFQDYKPKCINGTFGLRKSDGRVRVILDLRRGNLYFNKPPGFHLLDPSWLVEIVLDGDELAVGKTDIAQFFNRIEMPEWCRQYFGLPPVWSQDVGLAGPPRLVYPTLRVCPMGFSWSCVIAAALKQAIVAPVLRELGVLRIDGDADLALGADDAAHGDYIDDDFALACDDGKASEIIAAVKGALGPAGFPSKPSKDVLPDAARLVTEVVGLALSRDGLVLPAAAKLARCSRAIRHLLRARRCSSYVMSVIVGNFGWLLLANRPILSVLDRTFNFISAGGPTRCVPRGVLLEIRGLLALAPLLVQDLKRQPALKMLATDASKEAGGRGGEGVTYADITRAQYFQLQRQGLRKGWHTLHDADRRQDDPDLDSRFVDVAPVVRHAQWKTAISHAWQYWTDDSIHVLEMRGVVSGLKWIALQPSLHETRVPIFVDSQAALGALAKGRSSSRKLNRFCRRAAAYQLAARLRVSWLWIPSKANPADGPSRPRMTSRGRRAPTPACRSG